MSRMVSIRPARPSDSRAIASIHVDTWRRTYAGIVRRDILSGLSKSERAGYWRAVLSRPGRRGFLLVAEVGRRLVGFVSGGPGREDDAQYKGEIYAIYVLPRMQFRGAGRALFLAAVDCLLLAGIRSLLVWTLAANPYRRFYESLGGEPVRKRTTTLGGQRLREVGYGWADIKPLAPPFVLPMP